MSNIQVRDLIELDRFPSFKLLFLILYLPLGIVLFILRTVFGLSLIVLGYVLADNPVTNKVINTIACFSLGINVTVENIKKKEDVSVYITNSVSIFDQLALFSVTGSVSPTTKSTLIKTKGTGLYYCGSDLNIENVTRTIRNLVANKIPLHFSPEGKITNGRALLKFRPYPFQFSYKVQPVCISIERPFLDISVNVCGSTYFSDLLYFMFSPLTNYKLKFLTPLEKGKVTDSDFAEIVRQTIASGLNIETPDLAAADLNEYEKQKLAPRPERLRQMSLIQNAELEQMALQVREVLPHVPLNAIYNDIVMTRSVDITITNILNGRVNFVRTPLPSSSEPSTSGTNRNSSASNSMTVKKDMFNTAAASFPKSTSERIKSFQERKQQLIANARRRYIEKHNLDIPL